MKVGVSLRADDRAVITAGRVAARTHLSALQTSQAQGWLSERLIFPRTSLKDAAAEFNRYHRRQIAFADPRVGDLRISGTFATADADAFIKTLDMFHLRPTVVTADTIVLGVDERRRP